MKRRIAIDIEVDWNKIDPFKLVIQKGSSPITLIAMHDSYSNKYFAFFYHKKIKIKKENEYEKKINKETFNLVKNRFRTKNFVVHNGIFLSVNRKTKYTCLYFYFNDEKVMLKCFLTFIREVNPDIYNGFFIKTFDLVYIINRCKSLKIDSGNLSPLREAYVGKGRATLRGCIIYDIAETYAKFMGSHRHKNSLKKLAESHLNKEGEKKITKLTDSIITEDWYDKDIKKFIRYGLIDVELCVLLEEQLGLIDLAEQFVAFTSVNPDHVRYASNLIESFWSLIKPLYEKEVLKDKYKVVFQTKRKQKHKKSAGAFVFKSKKGLYAKGLVIDFDLERTYPNIIRTINASIETYVNSIKKGEESKYNYIEENDVYFLKEPIGFVPFSLNLLFKLRDAIEIKRNEHEYGTKEYREWDKKRQCVKDTINAVSGQFDFEDSIINRPEIADSYRLRGQTLLKMTSRSVIKYGELRKVKIEVLYGDTDSLFVWLPEIEDLDEGVKIASEICAWIEKSYDIYAKKQKLEKHEFKIGIDKIFDVYLSTGKKKKYFGHVLYANGKKVKEESSLFIRGYESRRSDSSEFTDKSQRELFDLINKSKKIGWKKTRRLILKKLRFEYPKQFEPENFLEIGIPKQMKQSFKSYKVRNPWLDGCKFSNKYLGTNFDVGSKPKLLYIKKVKRNKLGIPNTRALCVDEGMKIPEGIFIVDKQSMMKKTVYNKLKSTLEVVGIPINEVMTGKRQTDLKEF